MRARRRTIEAIRRFEKVEQQAYDRYGLAMAARFVELRDPPLRVRVLECGEGPPALLIAGDGAVAASWAPLLAQLPGRRAIVLDRPGFGLGPEFDYRGVDLRGHAVALLGSLLDALGLDSVTIVGSSGGGEWSLWFTVASPARVRALAPMGIPAVCLPGFRPDPAMRVLSLPVIGRLSFAMPSPSPELTGKMLANSADARLVEHPEIVAVYHEARRLPAYGRTAAAIFRCALQPGGAARPSMVLTDEEQARIAQPAMFVWGDREPYGPPDVGRRAAGLMRNARVEVIENAWHHPWLADPPEVGRLLRGFLAEHDP